MKIKRDFVTNSSSTCYVVFIPPNLVLEEREVRSSQGYKDWDKWDRDIDNPEETAEYFMGAVNDGITMLKKGESVWREDLYTGFFGLTSILETRGLKVVNVDISGGSGVDQIVPITAEHIEKVLPFMSEKLLEKVLVSDGVELKKKGAEDVTTEDQK
ncbi:MAG: hypothetical protein ACTSX1_03705 [Candidatus Heimdallarchaeaceae archaeon]